MHAETHFMFVARPSKRHVKEPLFLALCPQHVNPKSSFYAMQNGFLARLAPLPEQDVLGVIHTTLYTDTQWFHYVIPFSREKPLPVWTCRSIFLDGHPPVVCADMLYYPGRVFLENLPGEEVLVCCAKDVASFLDAAEVLVLQATCKTVRDVVHVRGKVTPGFLTSMD